MEYNKSISEMCPGDRVEGFYVLSRASERTTQAGKPYLSVTIGDASGTLDGNMWEYGGGFGPDKEGSVVKIRGEVQTYKGALQINIERIREPVQSDSYDLSVLVPTAPIDPEDTWNDILYLIGTIEDGDYRAVCNEMMRRHADAFKVIPAAKSVHHGFLNGLMMHTYNMLLLADFLAGRYSEIVDRSLLIAGTLLHDVAKYREFDLSPLGLVKDYSTEGKLIGHLVAGAQEVRDAAAMLGVPEEKSVLLQHMLLSHHGQPEFGACVLPQTAEAELLSYIDLVDSRMEIYAETFAKTKAGEFSERVYALDGKRLYNHFSPEGIF